MSKKVIKMLSPEEQTALSNIQSILAELLAMGGAEAPMEEPEVEMAENEMMDTPEDEESEGKEVKMIVKGIEETQSDAATASDNAETRIDETQSEQDEENVNEVAKQLVSLLQQGTVKKSAVKKLDPTTAALAQIVQVVKSQNERQSVLEETLGHVLSSMGVMKQLEVAKAKEKKQPIVNNDNTAVLKAIQEALGVQVHKSENETYISNSQKVKKNLGSADVLKGLLGK
jgi:hypothetical protein